MRTRKRDHLIRGRRQGIKEDGCRSAAIHGDHENGTDRARRKERYFAC